MSFSKTNLSLHFFEKQRCFSCSFYSNKTKSLYFAKKSAFVRRFKNNGAKHRQKGNKPTTHDDKLNILTVCGD